MTTSRTIDGACASDSITTGTATLYGRFAHRVHGSSPPSSAGQSSFIASARMTRTRSRPAVTSSSGGINARLNFDRQHARPGRGERHRQRPQAGADLHDPVPRGHPRVGHDGPREVRVDQEVLSEGLGGRDAVAPGQVSDSRRRRVRRRGHQASATSMTPVPSGRSNTNRTSRGQKKRIVLRSPTISSTSWSETKGPCTRWMRPPPAM